MHKYILALVALIFPCSALMAAPCASPLAMPESTPTDQFTFVDGQNTLVVVDNKTGLMWARCAVGFVWDPSTGACENPQADSGMTWKSALEFARNTNSSDGSAYLGYNDWRLPNVKELASIIERNCPSLSINSEVFPGTLASVYWTNTHDINSVGDVKVIDFSNGGLSALDSQKNVFLRLVRDAN